MHATTVQRSLIAVVQVLTLTVWFSASAVVPALRSEWGIDATAAVWLTASVQIGFVVGAVSSTALNLADRLPSHLLMAGSALAAAAATAAFALTAHGLSAGIALRFVTGLFLAGVYPVGMKLMASWSQPHTRARAFGVLIGALTLGSALPHLIGGLGSLPWRGVMLTAAVTATVGALAAATLVRPGPLLAQANLTRPNPRYAVRMFAEREPRLVNLGYFGHMWELYALWTWIPSYLVAANARRVDGSQTPVQLTTFLAMGVAGVVGCLVGGWAADRFGRPAAATTALAVSGLCCLVSPLVFGTSPVLMLAFAAVWGATVIADSGVFSTALSEVADQRYVGTALTAQTAIGFLLTVVTIQLVPVLAGLVGWQYSLLLLAPGPIGGAMAMARFGRRHRRARPDPAGDPRPRAYVPLTTSHPTETCS